MGKNGRSCRSGEAPPLAAGLRRHHPSLRLKTTTVDSACSSPHPVARPSRNLFYFGTRTISPRRILCGQPFTRPAVGSATDPYSPAPARHTCHHDERHPRVRSDVRLALRSYVPLCVPPERCDAVSLHSVQPASREPARTPSRLTTAGSLAAALRAGTKSRRRPPHRHNGILPTHGGLAAGGLAASASRISIPPLSGSCALVTPDSPHRDCFVRHSARCLPFVRCSSRSRPPPSLSLSL